MEEQGLGAEAIRAACAGAAVRLEGQENGQNLSPCARCSRTRPKKLLSLDGAFREEPPVRGASGQRVFLFDRCKSNCNSSRLHVGGRVVLVVTVRGPQGPMAAAVSEPLALVSKTSYTRRPRAPPQIRWVDQDSEPEGHSDPRDAAAAAAADPAPAEDQSTASEPSSSQATPRPEPPAAPDAAPARVGEAERGGGGSDSDGAIRGQLEVLLRLQSEQLERVRALRRLLSSNR
eukprot:m51a1_g978 hypothetical protein (232) ;mRNA; r:407456-408339